MKKLLKNIITFCLFSSDLLASISIVYNLRIAETTRKPAFEDFQNMLSHGVITLFNQLRNKGDGSHERIGGGMATLAYVPESFYLRVDFAAANARSIKQKTCFSRTLTDDILFSGGYSNMVSKRTRMTFSGYLGIPTHKDASLEGIQFGYAHVGIGAQFDTAFAYTQDLHHVLRGAVRYIHFFRRHAFDVCDQYNFYLGNLSDLFIALNSRFGHHRIEGGYNPSFFYGARIKPNVDDIANNTNYMRNSFYTSYKYRFSIRSHPSSVALALSYGFDIFPRHIGRKQIFTIWGSWSVHF